MKLFVLTQLSELIIEELLKYPDSVVVTISSDISNAVLSQTGIECIRFADSSNFDKDKVFFDKFMPGILDGMEYNGLPIHEALSIDRFRFWDIGESFSRIISVISQFDPAELYISADIYSALPWALARLSTCPVTAIAGTDVRTREFFDYYRYAPIDKIIVRFDDEKAYLESVSSDIEVESAGKRPKKPQSTQKRRSELKKSLGFDESSQVIGVIYDKRDIWQFNKFMSGERPRNTHVIVFPYDTRSSRLFDSCTPKRIKEMISVNENTGYLNSCDKIVMFRYLEGVYEYIDGTNIEIYDYHNLNRSLETSHGATVKI